MERLSPGCQTTTTGWLGKPARAVLAIVDGHLAHNSFILGRKPATAGFSLCGLHYYREELPGWKHPCDLVPGGALGLSPS